MFLWLSFMKNKNLEEPIVFPARKASDSIADDASADVWKALKLAAGGPCRLDDMRLIRWEGVRGFLGERWDKMAEGVAASLRAAIEERLSSLGECIRYDDLSFLVVCHDFAAASLFDSANTLTGRLSATIPGISGHAGLIQAFKPVSLDEEGFGFIRIHDQIKAAGQPDLAPVSKAPPAVPNIVMADPEFRFYPLWDVRRNDVFCYLCEPLWDAGEGEPLAEDSMPGLFTGQRRILALDLEALRRAVAQAEEAVSRYSVMKVLAPVHFQTIASAGSGESYVKLCRKLVWSMLDYVFFEIVKPPLPFDGAAVEEAINLIRPYGSGVMLRVMPDFDDFGAVPAGSILSLGLNLRGDSRDEGEAMGGLKHFASKAAECGMRSHVHGLATVTISAAAVSAGFDYVGSDDIAPALDGWRPEDGESKPSGLLKTLLKTKRM